MTPGAPRLWPVFLPLLIGLSVAPVAAAQDRAPATPVRPVTDTLYGTPIPDAYRWLEADRSEEVKAWFWAQGAYARAALEALPGRAAILDRIRAIGAAAPPEVSLPREAGARWFYTIRRAGESVARGYVRDAWTGEERLLVNPATIDDAGRASTLAIYRPSPDGRLLLYGLTSGGSEDIVLRVRDVPTGRDIAAPLERARSWSPFDPWSPDGRSFFYVQRRDLPADAPPDEFFRGTRVVRHRLGEDVAADVPVFSGAMVGEDEGLFPLLDIDARNGVAFGMLATGVEQHTAFYIASADRLAAGTPEWRPLFTLADSVLSVAVRGTDLYVLTWKGTPRIVRTRFDSPDLESADVLLTRDAAGRMQAMKAALDGLYVDVFRDGLNRVTRIAWDGTVTPIELPAGASVDQPPGAFQSEIRADPLRAGVLLTLTGWTAVARSYRYDPSTGALEDLHLRPVGTFERFDEHVVETVNVPSHDGVRVPLIIIRPRGLVRDGTLPVMLTGYGAYGRPDYPFHVTEWRPWYEAGGADAICHVRGGGYHGAAWHEAGRQATKPNTWRDLIACAEYLVREGYTRPERLVALGVSAGGITVGRAITERPDLFAGAVIQNGLLDAVRFETTQAGPANALEFGSVATEEGFRALIAMSAVHHVLPGTGYPAVLLMTGLNDPRVPSWQSGKMAAALQAATTSGRPVLLRVDEAAGHFSIGGANEQFREETADLIAFMMAVTGMPAYLPPASH